MDPETLKLVLSGGGTLALALMVLWEQRASRIERREDHREVLATLDKMVERLARIDVRTAESEAVPEPVRHAERSRRLRTRTPVPTPFMDDDSTPPRGKR